MRVYDVENIIHKLYRDELKAGMFVSYGIKYVTEPGELSKKELILYTNRPGWLTGYKGEKINLLREALEKKHIYAELELVEVDGYVG